MKDKIIFLIIGILVGAGIATGAFFIYTSTHDASCSSEQTNKDSNLPEMLNGEFGEPPEMPNGERPEMPNGENGEKPTRPNKNNNSNNSDNNNA